MSGLFRERYPEMVRLADLLGADDAGSQRGHVLATEPLIDTLQR